MATLDELFFADAWHEQMFVEMKFAYRVWALTDAREGDDVTDAEIASADKEFTEWLERVKYDAWSEGVTAGIRIGQGDPNANH